MPIFDGPHGAARAAQDRRRATARDHARRRAARAAQGRSGSAASNGPGPCPAASGEGRTRAAQDRRRGNTQVAASDAPDPWRCAGPLRQYVAPLRLSAARRVRAGMRGGSVPGCAAGPCRDARRVRAGMRGGSVPGSAAGPCRDRRRVRAGIGGGSVPGCAAGPCRDRRRVRAARKANARDHARARSGSAARPPGERPRAAQDQRPQLPAQIGPMPAATDSGSVSSRPQQQQTPVSRP